MSVTLKRDQKGMASILVALIMMLVITLVVIGFTQISRSNQRQALDNQLSATAYYAAETGVNDAITALKANPGLLSTAGSSCTGPGSFITSAGLTGSQNLSPDGTVGYTCLLVNSKQTDLNTDVAVNQAIVLPVNPSGDTGGLKISWNASKSVDSTNIQNCVTAKVFTPNTATGWTCPYGVLKMDLVEYNPTTTGLSGTSDTTATNLEGSTRTFYLVPMNDPGSTYAVYSFPFNMGSIASPPNPAQYRGGIIPVSCNLTNCSVVINRSGAAGTNFGTGGLDYYVRFSSTYSDAKSVTIAGVNGGISFSNAQVLIDATGKAQDELRRIQVRVPMNGSSVSSVPSYSLTSTDKLCKFIQSYSDGSSPTGSAGPSC